jgi:hypothetical protein
MTAQSTQEHEAIAFEYDKLPGTIKNNLTEEQWEEAQSRVVGSGSTAPDAAIYINLKNGQMRRYEAGDRAEGPLLAAHNLAGGRGKDNEQFSTVPDGAPDALKDA